MSNWTPVETIKLGGQVMATSSRKELTEVMVRDCVAAKAPDFDAGPRVVFDVNGQGLSLLHTDPAYRAAMSRADLVHADGGFLVTASRWLAPKPIAERSATTDLFHDFAAKAQDQGLSFYLLGGTEAANMACADVLMRQYPKLQIVGRRNGYFAPEEEEAVIADINAARPDILWVGLGKPKEQLFSSRYADNIRAGWLVTCGGCFNFVTGHYKRAPKWMQRANLEWVHRMATDRRLFWRYLLTSPHALLLLVTQRQ